MHKDTSCEDNDANAADRGKTLQVLVAHTIQAGETILWK